MKNWSGDRSGLSRIPRERGSAVKAPGAVRGPARAGRGSDEPAVVIFSGGGTRGFLHGGFLRALHESPVRIASLTGISIGAWAASFYALGRMSVSEMVEASLSFDTREAVSLGSFLANLARRGSGYRGVFDHTRITRMVEQVVGDATFRETIRPLRIQATDLATGQAFMFSRETTPDARISLAITASSCLAGIFEPVTWEGRTLVDGTYAGTILPEEKPTIISNVSPIRESHNVADKSIFTLMMRSSSFLPQLMIDEYKRRNPRVLEIVHDCRDIGMLSFNVARRKKQELMERSYELCRRALGDYVARGRIGAVVAA